MAKQSSKNPEVQGPLKAQTRIKSIDEYEFLGAEAFPAMVSSKFDGYRCLTDGPYVSNKTDLSTIAWSPSQVAIPNLYVQKVLALLGSGLDGELLVGESFQDSAQVTRIYGEPEFVLMVFDCHSPQAHYPDRLKEAERRVKKFQESHPEYAHHVQMAEQILVHDMDELREAFDKVTSSEGAIVRQLSKCPGHYEFNRVGYIVKIKFKFDCEAVITGFEQEKYGWGLKTIPQHLWGTLKPRYSAVLAEGLPGTPFEGQTIRIGTGHKHSDREEWYKNPDKFIGQYVKFTYIQSGTKNKPRHPSYEGIRWEGDL